MLDSIFIYKIDGSKLNIFTMFLLAQTAALSVAKSLITTYLP